MEQRPPVKYFRSALNGFDKKDVTEYITKMHMTNRKEIDKYKQHAASLQMTHNKLQSECELLKQQLAHKQNQQVVEVPVERVVEKIVKVPVERVVEKIVEVPVEKVVTLPSQTFVPEPDEELIKKVHEQKDEIERLSRQVDAHISIREQLEREKTATSEKLVDTRQRADRRKEEIKELRFALKALESKVKTSIDAEAMAYHRAEAIEREARYNAAQIRLALEELLREAQEVIRGVKTQTSQETNQITARANQFLDLLANMPEMLDIVSRQVEAVRPDGIATPMMMDTFE